MRNMLRVYSTVNQILNIAQVRAAFLELGNLALNPKLQRLLDHLALIVGQISFLFGDLIRQLHHSQEFLEPGL